MSYQIAVLIDLSNADLPLFEAYEAAVLALLSDHGGALESRVRSTDDKLELHLIHFPDESAFDAFRFDPRRTILESQRECTGAIFDVRAVRPLR